jgi:hypothetical protein
MNILFVPPYRMNEFDLRDTAEVHIFLIQQVFNNSIAYYTDRDPGFFRQTVKEILLDYEIQVVRPYLVHMRCIRGNKVECRFPAVVKERRIVAADDPRVDADKRFCLVKLLFAKSRDAGKDFIDSVQRSPVKEQLSFLVLNQQFRMLQILRYGLPQKKITIEMDKGLLLGAIGVDLR